MNTAYALFDKTNKKITFKYNTELTSNLYIGGLSTLSNISVPVTATINTANVTTGNIITGNITTGNIPTLNSTVAILSNINNQSFNGNVATLSNITVTETATLSNLAALTSSLSNISVSGRQLTCTNPEGYRIRLSQNNAEFTIDNVNFGRLTFVENKFGINSVTPAEALDVAGNAKITGNIDLGTYTSSTMRPLRYKWLTTTTFNSTTTLVNLSAFNLSLNALSVYMFKATLVYEASATTAGFKLQVDMPTTSVGTVGQWTVTSLPSPSANQFKFDGSTNDTAVWSSVTLGKNIVVIEGWVYVNGSNTMRLNYAPNSTGTITMQVGSMIEWSSVATS